MQITEIYKSIQGESSFAGLPCVFVRTTGCNLRCRWCDSAFAFFGGESLSVAAVVERVVALGGRLVEVTGGEPLLQSETPELVGALLDRDYTVLVETGGSMDITVLDPRTVIVMDIKCPGSGMSDSMRWENIAALRPTDQVKFVVADRHDFDWAVRKLRAYPTLSKCEVLFSPAFGVLEPRHLADWIISDQLSVRLQIQIHKVIWHPEARGV